MRRRRDAKEKEGRGRKKTKKKKICSVMLTAILFTIVRIQIMPNCPSTEEWTKTTQCEYIM